LANVGVRWSQAEVDDLLQSLSENQSIPSIALKLKRTSNAIQAKLAALANAAIVADPSAQQSILLKYHVTMEDIENLSKQNLARSKRAQPKVTASVERPAMLGNASVERPAMLGKPWAAEHNEELMKLAAARKPIAEISTLLARSAKSVEMRIASISMDQGLSKVR
jgi:hypothetical protein